jgi:hypothetical protein
MLKRCESIAHHENHVDRRSYEPVAAPRQRIEKETLMRRHRLIIGLLIIIGAARFAILLMSQTHVHSDEAIIGLKHSDKRA